MSTDDEREALTYLITAFRFRERGLRGVAMEPDLAVSRPLAEFLISEGFHRTEVQEPSAEQWEAMAVTDADLDRFEGIADPIYRSTAEASKVSKYLVSDLGQWIVRLVAEVRRLRKAEAEDERIDAWHMVADHEAFKACYDEEQPLIDSVLARITYLHELETTVNELAPAPTLPLEPSDAQVNAFIRAINAEGSVLRGDIARFALRAAFEAGGEAR